MIILLEPIPQADGSAQVALGESVVIATVHGPGPVKVRNELADQATLQITVKPSPTHPPSIADQLLAVRIEAALRACVLVRLHPRSLITVCVQPVKIEDGSYMACAVNAVIAALLDACIPMQRTLVALSGSLNDDGQAEFFCKETKPFWLFIDPAAAAKEESQREIVIASQFNHPDSGDAIVKAAIPMAIQIDNAMRTAFKEKYQKYSNGCL